jgi:hypothetical protein
MTVARGRRHVDDDGRDLVLDSVVRTRRRVRELEREVEAGRYGAKEDLAIERRTLARLKRKL